MILTGAYPYQMGISLNDWFEPGKGPTYCVQDAASPQVVGKSKAPGLSPRNLLGSTVGDELKNAGHPSQVVAIALKDRAAILLGGHRADLALWLDAQSMQWTTSRYYLPEGGMPKWVVAESDQLQKRKGKPYTWAAPTQKTGLSSETTRPFSYTTEFGSYDSLGYPLGIEITVDAAIAATKALKLGKGSDTDLLAVSFSSHDYLAHRHGANSREMEEMTVAEDRQLARLLTHLRRHVPGGLDHVVVVLTADHGGPSAPEWLAKNKIDAGEIDEASVRTMAEEKLVAKFGAPKRDQSYIAFVNDLNFFLNPDTLKQRGLSPRDVEAELKQALLQVRGALSVFTRSEYLERKLPAGLFEKQILKGYHLGRSGDVVIIPKPFFQSKGSPVSHQTGYSYDRTVPLILAGDRIRPGVYSESADVIDIAPTLSFLLGILPPAMSEGRVLNEALGDRK